MKNITLILLTLLTLAGCSDKRESDISPNFKPGQTVPAGSLSAAPSNHSTNENTPYTSTVPANTNSQLPAPVYSVVNQPVHGTVNLNTLTGFYTYTPDVNYSGPDLFTWQVTQGTETATSSVNINVVPSNLPPTANPISVTVVEDTPLTGTLTGTDPNGDPLTCSVASLPLHGTLIVNPNCTYTYTPNPNYFGPDSFTFQVSDGPLTSPPATVSINVTPVNDAPVASGSSFSTPEDTPHSGVLTGSDIEGSTLTYAVGTSPLHGTLTVNPSTGAYTYTPAPNYFGPDSFTFTVNDGTLTSPPATVSITVTPANDPPTALTQSFTTPEDTLYSGTLSGVDPEGNNLTYILTSSPTKGLVTIQDINLGTFTYQPYLNQTGTDSFTFKVNDGLLDSPSVTVFVNITPLNDAPVALNSSFSVIAGGTHNSSVTATDVDSPVLTYILVSNPTQGSLTLNPNGTYTYIANPMASGTDSFTFKANDSLLDSNVATVNITIGAAANQPPVAQNTSLTLPEDTVGTGSVVATDPESAPLTYILLTGPLHGSLVLNPNGTYTYTPNPNYNGPDSFTFKANDGVNDSNVGTLTLNVTPVNDLPVATNANYTINENQSLSITLMGSDVDGNALTYSIVSSPLHGSLSVSGSNVTYTPALNYNGPDSFTFKVNDGTGDSNVATIGITVTEVNQSPIANNQNLSTPEDSPLAITLLANDPDGDTLTYSVVTPPLHGTLSGTAPNLVYTPNPNYNGPDSFTFKSNDGSVDSNVATISLNVTPVNDAPVASNQSVTTPEETAVNITLVGSDIDGNSLIYTIVAPPTHGTLSGTGSNVVYTPNSNYNGTDSFTFKVNDGTTDSNTATVSITVTQTNDAPVALNQSVTTPEDTGLNITLTANDIDANSLSYTIVTPPTHGTLSGSGANVVYTPNANYNGPDSFTFKANDGTVDSNIATVTITVTPVNDSPVANGQNISTPEDTPYNGTLTGSDPESSPLTFIQVSPPTHGVLVLNPNGTYTYTPNPDYTGPDSFTVKANDGNSDSPVVTVSITVTPVNDAPVAYNQSLNINEDSTVNITLTGSDVEGSPLTYTVLSLPLHGTISGTAPNLVYTPNSNYNGTDTFTFRVNDGASNSNVASIFITINPMNDAPTAIPQSVTVVEDTPTNITLSGTDPDGNPLTYIIVNPPLHGTLSGTAPNLVYTPNPNYNGPDTFSFKVNDGTLDSAPATISLNVTPANDAPVANNQTATTPEDTVVTIPLLGTDADGNPLTYIIVNPPLHGSLVLVGSDVNYIPAANYSGPDSFTYKVNDGSLDSNIATVSITVTPVNDAPVASNSLIAVGQGQTVNSNMIASDVEGSPLTYSLLSSPTKGTITFNPSTGAYSYTANILSTGQDTFTFKVNDGSLDSNVATVTININTVNSPPVANNQSVTTPEDTNVSSTLTYSDLNLDTVTFAIVANPLHGTVNLNPVTGAYTYIPALNYNGPDSFTFKVNDGTVNSNTATVSINVTPVNDAPLANSQNVTTPEDTALNITLTGSDVEGSPITYTILSAPLHGTISGTAPNLVYTPTLNYNGPDSFTFKTNDGTVDSLTATVSINVTPVNDLPVANNQSVTTPEETSANITLTATDADGNPLTYTILSAPLHGTISGTAPNVVYTPNANYSGPDSFTFRANDGVGNSNVATISINVTPVNDAPVANNQSISTPEDTPLNITLTGTDPDGNPLTYIIVSPPLHGTLSGTGANIVYTPAPNYFGPDSFSFKVNDGTVDSTPATIALNVTPVNDAPVANNQTISTPEDSPVNITLTATDADGNPLTYIIVNPPLHGTLSGSGANIVYTPNPNYFGPDSFSFKANDGTVDSNVATISLNVTPVNDIPVAQTQSVTTPEDTAANITLVATDTDGNPLTYIIVTPPTNGTLSGSGANVVYTPNSNYSGPDSFSFKVNDGTVDSNTATVSINVTPVNDAPIAFNQSVTAQEDTPLNITLTATDVDGDPLTYIIVTPPLHGTLSGTGANIVYTPNTNYTGPDSFTFRANDGTTNSNVATISVNVDDQNDAPVAANQSLTTPEDTPLNITLTGTDLDGDTLSYIIVSAPLHGTLTGTGSNRVYTPAANYNGPDSFTYKVNDGSLDSNVATISLNVTPVNDAPIANGQSLTVVEDSTLNITLTGSDADGDAITYTVVSGPSHGTLTGTGANRVYTPALNYNGPDSFTFKTNDGTLDSTVATISLTVTPANDAPVANNQTITTPEDTIFTGNLVATDADSNSLVYSVVAQGTKGVVTITNPATGAFTYTPNANANGSDSFTFKVNDGTVDSNIATVSVNITPVNDAPIAQAQTITTPEDSPVNITLVGTDVDGNPLTYTIVSAPLHGTLTGTGANRVYTPNANYTGPDSFTFKVNDGTIDSNTATISLNVTPVNDAPVANNQTITTPEDVVYTGSLVGTDADGNPLVYSVVTQGTKGTVVITNTATGAFTYTPNANANGADSFTFKVNDGTVNSNTATVTVNITPVNDTPIAQAQSVTTPEDTNKLINLVGTDVDGNTLSYIIVTNPTNGTLVQVGADVTYIPNLNYNGPDSFTFKTNDGTVDSNIATVSISVTPVNDAPVANNSSFTTPEDTVFNGSVTATDVEGNPLTYSVVTAPTKGSLTLNTNGTYTYTPNLNQNGADSFVFRANDGTVFSNNATVSINITPVNDAPIAQAQSVTTPEDTAANITLLATDVDGDSLTYTIISGPTNGTLTGTGANRVYTPNANYSGSDSFTFRVNDGTVNSNTATVSINVTPVNDAPVANNQSISTNKNTVKTGTVVATDIDSPTLTYSVVTAPLHGTVSITASTGAFTYTPTTGYSGPDSFTFKANDGTSDSNIATVSITVVNTNVAPIAQAQSLSVITNSTNNSITLVGTDADSDPLTYTIVSGPTSGTLTGTGANRLYTPNSGFSGTDTFTFKVNDGSVDSNIATVTITVNEWCDTTFSYSHKLLLNNQDQASVLSNFPVMVKLNSNRVNYADIKANGDDLRFYDSSCNVIPYEIERWNTSGDSTVWVKVPSIAASSNSSYIWMSYGKASATAGQNKTAVWDANYVGVYHFEETSGNALDSTSFVNTMVPNGTPVRNVGGRVAGAELFDSTTDRFAATSSTSLAMTTSSNFTLEAWVYVVSNTSNANVIERQYSSTDGAIDYGLYVISGTPYMRARNKALQFNTQLPLTTWSHLTATFDRNTNTCTLFVNGVQKAQVTTCTDDLLATGTQPTYIGGDQSNRYFNGGVDEPRISNSARSPDWIRAQHLSMTDGMISYGTRRTLGQNPKQVLMTVKVTNDDGYIKTSSSQLFQTGSNGVDYMGSDLTAPKWSYYRFQLPATIPAGAVIKTAKLRLYGRDSSGSQYLTVHVQNSANAAQITAANQFPGGLGGVTVMGTNVSWGSPALTWLLDDWNQSPELKPAIDSLKTAQGGVLTSGNYIQVWVTKGAPITTTDIGAEDSTYETINHAQLTIEYE